MICRIINVEVKVIETLIILHIIKTNPIIVYYRFQAENNKHGLSNNKQSLDEVLVICRIIAS